MDKNKINALATQVFRDMGGAMTVGLAYIGTKTGLFQAMTGKGAMRKEAVADAAGLHARYVEEWLNGMVCAGYIEYEPGTQTYALSDEHAFLLSSHGTDHFMGGLFGMATSVLALGPRIADSFEHGGGVPFEDCGDECVQAIDIANRGNYQQRLAGYWLKALPEVVERLDTGGRALDVGCGIGAVPIALASAFPNAQVVGLDPDAESIQKARTLAKQAGMDGRVEFVDGSTADYDAGEGFDLVTACDCVHDFASPVATLSEIRSLLKPDGTLFVIEPKVADRLEDNINPIATMFYGFSVFHCLTQSLARDGAGLGACMGPAKTEALVREAGFGRFDVLDIKSPVNLFYAVRP